MKEKERVHALSERYRMHELNCSILAEEMMETAQNSLQGGVDDVIAGEHVYASVRRSELVVNGMAWKQTDATYVFSDPEDKDDWVGFITVHQRQLGSRCTVGLEMVYVRPECRGDRIGRWMCLNLGKTLAGELSTSIRWQELCLEAEAVHKESDQLITGLVAGLRFGRPKVNVVTRVVKSHQC